MDLDQVQTEVRNHYQKLSTQGFTNLVKELFEEVSDNDDVDDDWYFSSDPSDPEIIGEFGTDPLVISFGGRVWQFTQDVRAPSVKQFIHLLERNALDFGCFVTSSSFTNDAISAAESSHLPVRLVDGDDLSKLLSIHDIGVKEINGGYEILETFWDFVDRPINGDEIQSIRVPQADNFNTLFDTIRAVHQGKHFKAEIRYHLEQNTDREWNPRQANYYAQAGVILGFLSKSTDHYQGREMNRYELTLPGQDFIEALEESKNTEEEILLRQIRSVEVIERLIQKIENDGPLNREELFDYYEEQIAFSGTSTSNRRFTTVTAWLTMLNEIEVNESGATATFRFIQPQGRLDHYST